MKIPEEIIEQMRIEMPFHLPERVKPYIKEAMEAYAKQEAIEFLKWAALEVEGFYFINGDGQFELTGQEGLHSSAELYELFQQSKTTNT